MEKMSVLFTKSTERQINSEQKIPLLLDDKIANMIVVLLIFFFFGMNDGEQLVKYICQSYLFLYRKYDSFIRLKHVNSKGCYTVLFLCQ